MLQNMVSSNKGGDSETLKKPMTPKCLKAFRCFISVIAICLRLTRAVGLPYVAMCIS